MHHARNAEEHFIERITGRASSHVSLAPGASALFVATEIGTWNAKPIQGEIQFPNDVVRLVRVHDTRYRDWFDPPTKHLGQALTEKSPVAVASLAVAYLKQMLAEANTL